MHPVMITVPGWAFKFIVPALILWGVYSIIVNVNRNGAPPKKPGEGDAKDDKDKGPIADSPANALLSVAIGIGVFAYAAPLGLHGTNGEKALQVIKGFARGLIWKSPWESLPIYSYGVMLGLSLVVGWYVVLGLTDRQGLPRDKMADCYVFTAFMAVVGARVLYFLTNLDEFSSPLQILQLRSGGLVAYGGFLGGLLGSVIYLYRNGFSLWKWADAAVPALGSGLMITRLGCYMYGCDFGQPLSPRAPAWLKFLGTFPHWHDGHGAPAWQQHVRLGFRASREVCERGYHGIFNAADGLCHIAPTAEHSVPVHPTQLYESLVGLGVFATLLFIWRRRQWEGQVFLAFWIVYGIGRFLLEIIRDDAERGTVGNLSTSQFIALVSVVICIPLYLYRRKTAERAKPANLFAPVEKPAEPRPAAEPKPATEEKPAAEKPASAD